jgi:RNA polymerase sigma-70 factor (ECF subfamily)
VTAEVFQRALANLRSFQWRGAPFGAWLMRIAANALADRSRRAAREVAGSDSLPDAGANPDLDRIDQHARLFRLVEELPADQRAVIVERFVEQRSIRDIAQRLRKTEGAIKQLQFRALQNLRTWMESADA